MDPFWQFLQSLGGGATSILSGLGGGNSIMGLLQLMNAIAGGYVSKQEFDWAKKVQGLQSQAVQTAMDPTKFMAEVTGLEQPLSQNLIQNTLNPVRAELASRGMATSPGQVDYATAQALAPYIQQQQQQAIQGAEYGLSYPLSMAYNYPTFEASGYAGDATGTGSMSDPFGDWLKNVLGLPPSGGGGGGGGGVPVPSGGGGGGTPSLFGPPTGNFLFQ